MSGDTKRTAWRAALAGGLVAAVLVLALPVVAAVGEGLILGEVNHADAVTVVSGAADASLRLNNTQAGAPALDLRVAAGSAPLRVNSTTRVANLNADRLDGKHASAYLLTTGQAADSALLSGRQLNQVRPFYLGCSNENIPGGLWLCQLGVSIPGPGTLLFRGSADAQYTGVTSSVLNCYFLIDGYAESDTYRHATLTPTQQYGFCASNGARSSLSAGEHTLSFYQSSSDQANTPLASGSVEVWFIPSS